MNKVRIQDTADGSHTLYVPELDEHYHSVNGAMQESLHVYIEAGLRHLLKKNIFILEIGFGTGLNAYLTMLEAIKSDLVIHYLGCEYYPLPLNVIVEINYSQLISEDKRLFEKLHEADWNTEVDIVAQFSLKKNNRNFVELKTLSENDCFDLIYYDAFAPDKQPEMWDQNIFDYLYKHTAINGVLVTYCAKGSVRRMLQQAGYCVERLPGPKGKREMLRATRLLN